MTIKKVMTPEEARRDHTEMLRFMAIRFAMGLAFGLTCAGLIFVLDIGSLGTRLGRASNPFIPVFLIAAPMGLTFGAVSLCIGLWTLPYERKFADEPEKTTPL